MRVLGISPLFVLLALTPSLSAQMKSVKVRHCPAADSALGTKSHAWRGNVSSYTDATGEIDLRGDSRGRARVTASTRVEGRTWLGVPPLALTVYLFGDEIDVLVGLGRDPKVTVVVDDSTTLETGGIKLGAFIAPDVVPKSLITLPVSTLMSPASFLTLARARSAYVRVEEAEAPASLTELRNIAALYAVVACGSIQ